MSRIILIVVVIILIYFVSRLVKLLRNFSSGSQKNLNDLKDRASHLKNKYKNIQEADFTEIPPEDDAQPFDEDDGKK
jgi:Sec-independent protein translocase protein TatA